MPKRLTQEEFIERARTVHGDKYDYSIAIYEQRRSPISIICKTHGAFSQNAGDHLAGHGCPWCKGEKNKRLVYGVGVNDMTGAKKTNAWRKWMSMLSRCYGPHRTLPTYIGCSVCDEWHIFSNFKKWFDDNYIEGYHLDKDIIQRGNKTYSPTTCCFVPAEINTLILNRQNDRGNLPLGVAKSSQSHTYHTTVNIKGKNVYLGSYPTIELAFKAYKNAKEMHIRKTAAEYYSDGRISKRVYDALMRWVVEPYD